ncbi:Imidazoleglycerol-phosphate dehydratase OS=Castellaniella defragrans OX=75697 GN=hisB PE=3 SV=1 [Castellaniella defragrans]
MGITLGQAFAQALGNKAGLRRYGHAYVPLDESLSRVGGGPLGPARAVLPRGLRPRAHRHLRRDLAREFFQGFVNHAQATVHIDNLRGENAHRECETIFKAFGRALRMATEIDPRAGGAIPSTEGAL